LVRPILVGSVSTILAANQLERNSVGIELLSKYVKIAKKRIKKINNDSVKSLLITASSLKLSKVLANTKI